MSDLLPDGRGAGLPGLASQAAEASAALGALAAPAQAAADAIDHAFSKAGASLTASLTKAASDGKVSLGELAASVVSAVDALAGTTLGGGSGTLADALASAVGGLFGGARADGGPVAAGAAYLVGERGPEVFRPVMSGSVDPAGGAGGGVTVNVSVGQGGAPALLRSEAQVAAALQRAVALGRRA